MKRIMLLVILLSGCTSQYADESSYELKYELSHICDLSDDSRVEVFIPVPREGFGFHDILREELVYKFHGKHMDQYIYGRGNEKLYINNDEVSFTEAAQLLSPEQFSICIRPAHYVYKSELIYKSKLSNKDIIEIYQKQYSGTEKLSPILEIGETITIKNSDSFYAYYNDELITLSDLIMSENIPYEIWNNMMESFGDNAEWSRIVRVD